MNGALSGLRVIDLCGGVMGGGAGRVFAELGADVLLVEPPDGDATRRLGPWPREAEGDPERSGLFLALHAGRRGLVLDPGSAEDHALLVRLASAADVLFTGSRDWGVNVEALRTANPGLVHVSITDHGLTGPYAAWQGDEITSYALGGYFYFGGEPQRTPLTVPGYQAWRHAGMQGALAALVGLAERDLSGQGQSVDVSAFEAMASAHGWLSVAWSHTGTVTQRTETDLNRCADGWVFVMVANLDGIALLVGQPELADISTITTIAARLARRQELRDAFAAWCADKTMAEIVTLGQELRIAVSPVATVQDLWDSAQLAAREWFRETRHPRAGRVRLPGAPFKLTATPARLERPAPLLGQHTDEVRAQGWGTRRESPPQPRPAAARRGTANGTLGLPLRGLRVVEITANWAGPLAGRYLGDLGAEVIKVEAPGRPATRALQFPGNEPRTRPYNRSGYFNKLNRNKLGLVLDLALPEGRERFLELIRTSDVLIENNSARVLPNLHLAYETLRQERPEIIVCSISGFGGDGPLRDFLAYGSNIETVSGLASLMTYHDDRTPHRTGSYYADPVAGGHAAIAVLAALRHRDRTGEGQWIDMSLLESAAAFFDEALMWPELRGELPPPRGNRHAVHAPQGVYRGFGPDSWLALCVRTEAEWAALCRVIGRADLAEREDLATAAGRHACHNELDAAIEGWSAALDHHEAARTLQAAGVAAAPVLANWELLGDPHLAARGFYVPVVHRDAGVLPFPGMPWIFGRTPGKVRYAAPCFAEHNQPVLRDLIGMSEDEVAALYRAGVTSDAPTSIVLTS